MQLEKINLTGEQRVEERVGQGVDTLLLLLQLLLGGWCLLLEVGDLRLVLLLHGVGRVELGPDELEVVLEAGWGRHPHLVRARDEVVLVAELELA